MTSLITDVYVPIALPDREVEALSFDEMLQQFTRFVECNLYAYARFVKYNFFTKMYSFKESPEKLLSLYSIIKIVNSQDIVIFMKNNATENVELISRMGFHVRQDNGVYDAIPFFLDDAAFRQSLYEIMLALQCRSACYGFHDFQSIVVWTLEP